MKIFNKGPVESQLVPTLVVDLPVIDPSWIQDGSSGEGPDGFDRRPHMPADEASVPDWAGHDVPALGQIERIF